MGVLSIHDGEYVDFSAADIWHVAGFGADSCSTGSAIATLGNALSAPTSPRIVTSQTWPWLASTSTDPAPAFAHAPSESVLAAAGVARLGSLLVIGPMNTTDIRASIGQGWPVVLAVPVFGPSVTEYWSHATVDVPAATDVLVGYHAVTITGYDDAAGRFAFMNHWSANWGDAGYGAFSYDFVRGYSLGGVAVTSLSYAHGCLMTNACGGCDHLPGAPGASCGTCGTYQCSGTALVCTGGTINACGGCATLPGSPGQTCGTCGLFECSGTSLVCNTVSAVCHPGDTQACAGGRGTQTCSSVCLWNACVCSGSLSMCGGACVDTQTDTSNCGACGRSCASGVPCMSGVCGCGFEQLLCGGTCHANDGSNCGACGNACGAGATCRGIPTGAGCLPGLHAQLCTSTYRCCQGDFTMCPSSVGSFHCPAGQTVASYTSYRPGSLVGVSMCGCCTL